MTAEMSGASSLVPASAWMSDALDERLVRRESAVGGPDAPRPISSALASNWVTIFWRICASVSLAPMK